MPEPKGACARSPAWGAPLRLWVLPLHTPPTPASRCVTLPLDHLAGLHCCPFHSKSFCFQTTERGNGSLCLGTGLLGAESQAWDTGSLGSGPSLASVSPCDPGPVPVLPWGWGLASQTLTLVLHCRGLHKSTQVSGFLSFPVIVLPDFQLQGRKQAEQCGGGVGGSNPRCGYHRGHPPPTDEDSYAAV